MDYMWTVIWQRNCQDKENRTLSWVLLSLLVLRLHHNQGCGSKFSGVFRIERYVLSFFQNLMLLIFLHIISILVIANNNRQNNFFSPWSVLLGAFVAQEESSFVDGFDMSAYYTGYFTFTKWNKWHPFTFLPKHNPHCDKECNLTVNYGGQYRQLCSKICCCV